MAAMTVGQEAEEEAVRIMSDPCCGSGRLLLAATTLRPCGGVGFGREDIPKALNAGVTNGLRDCGDWLVLIV